MALKASGYNPLEYYSGNAELKRAIDAISSGAFSGGNRELFQPIVASLLTRDDFLLLADYADYVRVSEVGRSRLLRRPRWLDAHVDPQQRPLRLLLLRPLHAPVLRGDLAGEAGAGVRRGGRTSVKGRVSSVKGRVSSVRCCSMGRPS
jgi:glucan phosphorylase